MTAGRDPLGPRPERASASTGRRDRITAAALLAGALVLYFVTASPHLAGGDNPEFVTIFAVGGVAHPSGYPLYSILLRLGAWMPGGAALGSSRVTAVIAALSVPPLYVACRAWNASPTAALVATASYALSPLAWRLATEAEVFALNALFAALLLCAASPGLAAAMAPARRVVLLAGLAGLALSNHHTIALLAPVGTLATFRALRESPRRGRVAFLGLASFGAGLLPYAYCYAVGRAPNGRYVWGEPGTWGGLLRHVTRADYGTLSLTTGAQAPDAVANVGLYFTQSASHLLVLPLLIGGVGFWRAFARASAPSPRRERATTPVATIGPSKRETLTLLATWALAGPLFAVFLNLPPEGLGATLVERFRLLPEVVLTIALAWGLDAARALRETRALAVAVAGLAVLASAMLHSWPQVQTEHSNVLELYTENTERSAPPRAVILGTGDYRLFSFIYADATKRRPDVTYVDPHLLGYDWYRGRASRELGAPISSLDPTALADQALALGRPVLVTDVFDPQIVKVFRSYPLGTLIRLLPRDAPLPTPESVEDENVAIFARFERFAMPPETDEWARAVLPTYERPWIALARMFERRGNLARARANQERAKEWTFLPPDDAASAAR